MIEDAHESAIGHVTGTARYVDDIPCPADVCHVAIGLSTIANGEIKDIDLDEVRNSEGVLDVVICEDIPGNPDIGAVFPGDPLLADSRIDFSGQAVFAVAASSYLLAQQAVTKAKIKYESRQPILTAGEAHKRQLYVLPSRDWQHGENTPSALKLAPNSFRKVLEVGGQEHFYVEGQVALAIPTEANGLDVYSSTQHPAEVQELISRVLDVPMNGVQVICRRMGGGFGGKESQAASVACLASLFATRLKRTVKFRMPRKVDMLNTGKRHDFECDYEIGFDNNGLLTAAQIQLLARCGYSPDLSEGIVDRAMFHATNAYYVPSIRITSHRCRTNTVSNTAFRGFGGPQGVLPMESMMDDIAFTLGIDPLDVRKQNLYRPGFSRTPYGQEIKQFVLLELIEQLEKDCDYRRRVAAIEDFNAHSTMIKRGLALTPVQFGISFTTTHLNQAGALVNLYLDGSIEVSHAGTEMGQGLYTKVRKIVADEFGIKSHCVRNTATRTDKVPNGSPTAASAATDLNGMAALDACLKIKQQLRNFAYSQGWKEPIYEHGVVSDGVHKLSFSEFLNQAYLSRTPLSATGFYRTPDIHFDKQAGKGHPFFYFAHGAAASEVEVDVSTGNHYVKRVDILHDCGHALNRRIDRGQIEGGYMQGLGWLTTEELKWDDDGHALATGPANYKVPAANDCPSQFKIDFFERENTVPSIRRSKAVGEPPLMLAISAWCALRWACAKKDCLPPLRAPATPEAVFDALNFSPSMLRKKRVQQSNS